MADFDIRHHTDQARATIEVRANLSIKAEEIADHLDPANSVARTMYELQRRIAVATVRAWLRSPSCIPMSREGLDAALDGAARGARLRWLLEHEDEP